MSKTTTIPDTIKIEDIVDIGAIAYQLDVTKQAVCNWITRYAGTESAFPEPIAELTCGRLFAWEDVAEWMYATGRWDIE